MASERPPEEPRGARSVALAHVHGRPGYPRECVDWLVPGQAKTVLEVGAGIGKLTEQLVAAGHAVHAVDRDAAMLEVLHSRVPSVPFTQGTVEELELRHRSVDAVVCSTAFTSFDLDTTLPVIAKALKTGGHLSVVWHERDTRIPWVRRLGAFLEGPVGARDNEPRTATITERLLHSPLFSFVEEASWTVWQDIDRETVADLVLSRSWVAGLSAEARDRAVAEVRAFYADYGRGMDGMQLPYRVHALRTQVVHQPGLFDDGTDALRITSGTGPVAGVAGVAVAAGAANGSTADSSAEQGEQEAPTKFRFDADLFTSDGTDTDMLLIDFS
ncbi:class I SAM-dependent methyltransferase [Nocardioides jishulii]|uniref:Class I SAM-dependent methyltransferase n=1 Tax=Nocardioides jishulii TaxID=2575440 RepID=A0A4U2YSA5_9ACTN|nr:class I SAM-dependent methyltransferase [Nocardioides jishulii]QCX28786.1 class I SAM-dependent methyltransferase [Nocardioides jishulii]TKI64318.1 class I SAM-dependent methyltransferase [Nocardioides jishulii]